ncbi:primosomal replication protein PriB/PriC domain protein [Pseudomonas putida]|nr:primosomal replication protein PriB/PriC domain protein [Pseudomonas putida]
MAEIEQGSYTARQMVEFYMQAEAEFVTGGKDVQFGNRRVVFESLQQIIAGRVHWERRVAAQARGGRPGFALASFD